MCFVVLIIPGLLLWLCCGVLGVSVVCLLVLELLLWLIVCSGTWLLVCDYGCLRLVCYCVCLIVLRLGLGFDFVVLW